jgi:hypothetical protein
MQDCIRCGKKAKTLYERHGEEATFVSAGYFVCHSCGYVFAKDQIPKNAVGAVQVSEQNRVRLLADTALHAGGREFESLPIH